MYVLRKFACSKITNFPCKLRHEPSHVKGYFKIPTFIPQFVFPPVTSFVFRGQGGGCLEERDSFPSRASLINSDLQCKYIQL